MCIRDRYNDGVVYVASRPRSKKKKNKNIIFDLKYYDLKKKEEASDFYEKDINALHHFGPCAFNPNEKEIFYSENYKVQKGSDGRYHMKLVRAVYKDGSWDVIDDFPFNSHEYSIFHPAISEDGLMMVFASNMPGGYGKMDLYSIKRTNSGWSLPVNLGPEINSASNDWFPTFHKNAHIFYSSDAKGGYGGLDILVCKFIDEEWRFPQNLGKPINSRNDDIGFTLSGDASFGFFSSNRSGGQGGDDIYKFALPQPMAFDDLETLSLSQVEEGPIITNNEVTTEGQRNFQFLILDNASNTTINKATLSYMPMLNETQLATEGFKEKHLQRDRAVSYTHLTLPTTPYV